MVPDLTWQWLVVFGAMAVAIAGAFLFSRLTEVHTQFFRDRSLQAIEYLQRGRLMPIAVSETRAR